MAKKDRAGPRRGRTNLRVERLAQALRANLKRRKAQARGRSASDQRTSSGPLADAARGGSEGE
ncbi:MAG TPA: hypothetical protein VH765_02200 [Xanthobacteraceae bacterium]